MGARNTLICIYFSIYVFVWRKTLQICIMEMVQLFLFLVGNLTVIDIPLSYEVYISLCVELTIFVVIEF